MSSGETRNSVGMRHRSKRARLKAWSANYCRTRTLGTLLRDRTHDVAAARVVWGRRATVDGRKTRGDGGDADNPLPHLRSHPNHQTSPRAGVLRVDGSRVRVRVRVSDGRIRTHTDHARKLDSAHASADNNFFFCLTCKRREENDDGTRWRCLILITIHGDGNGITSRRRSQY